MLRETPFDFELKPVKGSAGLLDAVSGVRLDVTVSGAGILKRHEGLLFKLRGALGVALGATELDNYVPNATVKMDAAHLLFAAKPKILIENILTEIAKPYALRASRKGQDLVFTILLFGRATLFEAQIAEALEQALGLFLDWRSLAKHVNVPGLVIKPGNLKCMVRPLAILGSVTAPSAATMSFVTGIEMNSGQSNSSINVQMICETLFARAAVLAPWFGVKVDFDRNVLRQAFAALEARIETDAKAEFKIRNSSRSGDQWQSAALRADVYLEGDLEAVWPLLRFGELVHLGRSAVTGLGRYVLINEN